MRPRERRDSGQNDLFKARLDQIVDMGRLDLERLIWMRGASALPAGPADGEGDGLTREPGASEPRCGVSMPEGQS